MPSAPEKDKAGDKDKVPKKPDASMQFQIEADDEASWRELIKRDGLIRPCISMVNTLKRVKVEVNDDNLWYGMACSDKIKDLERFKDQSEPCWLFVSGSKPIRIVRGCNVPELVNAIQEEFKTELLVMDGSSVREAELGFFTEAPLVDEAEEEEEEQMAEVDQNEEDEEEMDEEEGEGEEEEEGDEDEFEEEA